MGWRTKEKRVHGIAKKSAFPAYQVVVDFDEPVLDMKRGKLTGKGYKTVEEALFDLPSRTVKRVLNGEQVPVTIDQTIFEWEG